MNIEKIGVNTLSLMLSKTDCLDPCLNTDDKIPFFDGTVGVYSNSKKTKKDFVGNVPVQVKSTTKDKRSYKNTEYFPFEAKVEDIKGFLKENGVIYFVCYIDEHTQDVDVFVRALLPVDLLGALQYAENRKTKRFQFKRLPNNKSDIERIFFDFLIHQKYQSGIWQTGIRTDKELYEAGYTECFFKIDSQSPLDLVGKEVYSYARNSLKAIACSGVKRILEVDINDQNLKLKVGDGVFFKGGRIVKNISGAEVIFGNNSIRFPINNSGDVSLVNFNATGTLDEHMKCLKFIKAVALNGELSIGDVKLYLSPNTINSQTWKKDINDLQQNMQMLETIKRMLNKLSLNIDPVLSDETQINSLYYVASSFLYLRPISFSFIDNTRIIRTKIDDSRYLIFRAVETSKEKYIVKPIEEDLFDMDVEVVDQNNVKQVVSLPYSLLLHEKDFYQSVNLNLEEIHRSTLSFLRGDNLDVKINFILTYYWFKLVKAFDITGDKLFLQKAEEVLGVVGSLPCQELWLYWAIKINKWQLIKRQRSFTSSELIEINDFRSMLANRSEIASQTDEYLIAIYLLLDMQDLAAEKISKLSSERQRVFITYPIYKFMVGQYL